MSRNESNCGPVKAKTSDGAINCHSRGTNGEARNRKPSLEGIAAAPSEIPEALAALDLLSTPVWLWKPHGARILWCNHAALEYWAADDLDALQGSSSGVAQSTADSLAAMAQSAEWGHSRPGLWTAARDGRSVTVPCYFTALQGQDLPPTVLVELRDAATTSADDTADGADGASSDEGEHLNEVLRAQCELQNMMAAGASLQQILDRVAAAVERLLSPAICAIQLVDSSGQFLRNGAAPSLPGVFNSALDGVALGKSDSPSAAAAYQGQTVVLAEIAAESRWQKFANLALPHGLHACWSRPIMGPGGEVLGTFTFYYANSYQPSARELSDSEAFCSVTTLAILQDRSNHSRSSANQRFASLAASIPGVVYQRLVTLDRDIRYTYISEGAKDLFGVSPAEILADPQALFDRHGPEYRATFRERLFKASRELTMWDVEAQIITRDGQEKWTHAIARPRRQADGSVLWDGVILDATRIKKAERELSEAKRLAEVASLSQAELLTRLRSADERFASLAASVPGVVYQRRVSADGDIRYTYISDGAKDLFGVSPEEILADPQALFDCHGPEYRATFRERLLKASRELTMWDVEAQIITRDGQEKWTHAIARPHREPDGSVLWDGIILDATRIKRAERAAEAAAAGTRKIIVESLSQGFILYGTDDQLVAWNSRYVDLYPNLQDVVSPGMSYKDIARAELGCHGDGNAAESLDRRLRERLERHQLPGHVVEVQWPDGRWILISEHRTFDGSTIIFYTNVTELKRREEELQRINGQLDIALENMAQGLSVFDAEHRLVLSNRRYAEIFELPESLTREGVSLHDQMEHGFSTHNHNKAVVDELVQERLKHIDSREHCTFFLTFPDGRTVEVTHRPLADGGVVETFSQW